MPGFSLRGRSYRMRSDGDVDLTASGVMEARGIVDDPQVFLSPRLDRDMPDPMILVDMLPAAERIVQAVRRKEKVVVFGDYDVDGAGASAVMGRWFASVGLEVDIYIPDRITEGYGPTPKAMGRALANSPDLLICVDCGTAAVEVLDAVKTDVVVIDHHKQQGDLPLVHALVNPHRDDDVSGLGMLCATALCFMVVTAAQRLMREAGDLPATAAPVKDLLDIVALATVADVVPLIGPSRLFVAKGLEVIARKPSPGVAALMAVSGVTDPSAGKMGFALGPRINAGGRVGGGSSAHQGALGARLLMARDLAEAEPIAARLDAMNRERQEVEKKCLEEAMAQAAEQAAEGVAVISVFGAGWHPGVVGIVAGRLKEKYDMPAIVGALVDGIIKGSGRSIAGYDLGSTIVEAKKRGLLESGGGHAMACGIGCRAEGWAEFQKFIRRRAIWNAEPVVVDCLVDGTRMSMDRIDTLAMLEPLGMGNPSVRAAVGGLRIGKVRQLKNGHIKLDLVHAGGSMEGLWWRARDDGFEDTLLAMEGRSVLAIGNPKVDEWQGRRRITFELADLIPAGA